MTRRRCRARWRERGSNAYQTRTLTFLNNRHYDPTTGVFMSVDPLVVKTGQPYIYGAANPIRFSDPTGLDPDNSSVYRHRGYDLCTSSSSTCSQKNVRQSFDKIRHTDKGQAIFAAIDVAHQGDWDKLDGNWSTKDVAAAQNRDALLGLLGGNGDAASIVANIAAALSGHDELWESWDTERSWWDRNGGKVLSGLTIALDVLAVVSAGVCLTGNVAACGVSQLSSLGAAGLGAKTASDQCSGGGGGMCNLAAAATAWDVGGAGGGTLMSLGTMDGSGGAMVTILMSPLTLGFDAGFAYDAWTTNPFAYPAPTAADFVGAG